jgi:hypothetical protein
MDVIDLAHLVVVGPVDRGPFEHGRSKLGRRQSDVVGMVHVFSP